MGQIKIVAVSTAFAIALGVQGAYALGSCRPLELSLSPRYETLIDCLKAAHDKIEDLETENKIREADLCVLFHDLRLIYQETGKSTANLRPPEGCSIGGRRRK